jgi:uncharacterized protein (DUF1684 family)
MTLDLADYRRRVADLYAAVRGSADPEQAWLVWRQGRDHLLATHPESPVPTAIRDRFTGSPFSSYDPGWRVLASVDPSEQGAVLIDHSGEGATRFLGLGTARAVVGGEPIALPIYWLDSYGGGLFLPFGDLSNGDTTHGGGRYLLDAAKGADLGEEDGVLVLDFNFAYHPSCVWEERWSCPLPPPANTLPVAVTAGELLYLDG